MARIRYIKPTIGTDEDLATVSIPARYLFAILPTLCDREGRMEDSAKVIKLSTFPWDDIDVESLLLELARHQIVRYSVAGKRFLQIIGFIKHQRPHPGEEKSKIQSPPTRKIKLNGKKLNLISNNEVSSIKGDGDFNGDGDSIAPSAPEAVVVPPKPKEITPQQRVVRYFKEAKGVLADDKDWDRKHWNGRLGKEANAVLKAFDGDWRKAGEYILIKGEEWKHLPDWGLNGVVAAAGRDPRINGGEDEPADSEVGSNRLDGPGRSRRITSARELIGETLRSIENPEVPAGRPGDLARPGDDREYD